MPEALGERNSITHPAMVYHWGPPSWYPCTEWGAIVPRWEKESGPTPRAQRAEANPSTTNFRWSNALAHYTYERQVQKKQRKRKKMQTPLKHLTRIGDARAIFLVVGRKEITRRFNKIGY